MKSIYTFPAVSAMLMLLTTVPLAAQAQQSGNQRGGPPQEAFDACLGLNEGAACSVVTPNGETTGSCLTGPRGETVLACVPEGGRPTRPADK